MKNSFATEVLGEKRPSGANEMAMRRSQSTPHSMHMQESSILLQKSLERQIRSLQNEVAQINDRLSVFEETNARWGLRYTRRLAISGNVAMGCWMFILRLSNFLRRRRTRLLQAMMPKIQLRQASSAQLNVGTMMARGIVRALRRAWFLWACALLLARSRDWSRVAGAAAAAGYLAYLSMAGLAPEWPWASLFAFLGNTAFLIASFNAQATNYLPSYLDFVHTKQEDSKE